MIRRAASILAVAAALGGLLAAIGERRIRQFHGEHTSGVLSVAFLSHQTAISSGVDAMARIWNVSTGEEIRRFQGGSVSISRDRNLE